MKQSFFLDTLLKVADHSKNGDYEASVVLLLNSINAILYDIAKDMDLIEEE